MIDEDFKELRIDASSMSRAVRKWSEIKERATTVHKEAFKRMNEKGLPIINIVLIYRKNGYFSIYHIDMYRNRRFFDMSLRLN